MLTRIFLPFIFMLTTVSYGQNVSRLESKESLYIELFRDSKLVGTATGFIIHSATRNYLVTNYHVITNKVSKGDKWLEAPKGTAPNKVAIFHNSKEKGGYVVKFENLFDKQGKKLWFENKVKGELIDVVALPLKDTNDVAIHPVFYTNTHDYQYNDAISVISFPKEFKDKVVMPSKDSAKIVGEVKMDKDGQPMEFVDEKTFNEMSGSPIFYYPRYTQNAKVDTTADSDYEPIFVGVFSKSASMPTNILKGSYLLKNFMKLP